MTTSQSRSLDRRVFLSSAGSTAGILLGAAPAQAAPDKDFSAVDAILAAAVKAGDVPWAALLVTRGGADLYEGAHGVPVSHVDVLRSATKVATVTAVLTLVEKKQLGLEDPVSRYIPAFAGDKAAITIRQLLSMSSGLRSSIKEFSDASPLSESVAVIAAAPLAAPPGTKFIYGNLGLTVAGQIAETVSGKSWDAFFQDAVAAPLNLDFSYGPLETGRLGGGGRTNLSSYGRLLKLHLAGGELDGVRIISPELIAQMQVSNAAVFKNPITQTEAYGYGMGWWFDRLRTDGSARVISDPGAWGAYPWIDRDRQYGAFVFVRKELADGVALVNKIRPLIDRTIDS
jgi:CubicO group peptidase (beta-lactamase class C family)